MKYLVTGTAGSGKSTLAEYMQDRGYNAVDIDSETNIAYSKNLETGLKDIVPSPRPDGWRLNHRWVWDGKALVEYLSSLKEKDTYLFGVAQNQADFYKYFDRLFILTLDKPTIAHRLATRTNNSFGKQKIELEEVLNTYDSFVNSVIRLGGIAVDAERPINEVVSEIVRLSHE